MDTHSGGLGRGQERHIRGSGDIAILVNQPTLYLG